jgi:predicted dehydrogenase
MDIVQESTQFITRPAVRRTGEIRVGVIGCGYWGPNLIRNFNESPKSKLVAVADLRQERLERIQTSYPKVGTFSDYHELFYQDLDAIVIATPPVTHYSIAKEVLENGLHAFIEKPMTLQSGHARELIKLAEKLDRVLMVGHAFEYNTAVQKLKLLIDSGEIGAIRYIDSARLNLGLYQNGTNVLWDLAPHDISILCYILGMEPLSVIAHGACCINKNIFDVVYMNLIFPDNIMAHIHVSWLDPYKVRRVTVVGSKKMAIFNDVESDKIKIIDKGVNTPADANTFADFQYSYRNGDILVPYLRMEEPLRIESEHFIDCINNHTIPRTNGEDGLRVVRVLEAAQRSLENYSRQEMVDHE